MIRRTVIRRTMVSLTSILLMMSIIVGYKPIKATVETNFQTNSISTRQVETGGNSSFYIDENSMLWGWGSNEYGQLGDGTNLNRSSPVKILDNVKSVSVGWYHTLAVMSDNTLWSWGLNHYGQLGDGTTSTRYLPKKIMENVSVISTGFLHSLAVKNDGSLWSWGFNSNGQIGDGTKQSKFSPVKIMENVISVSAGGGHSLAIKSDKSLWAWGSNMFGQLGDGTTSANPFPSKTMENVNSISTGDSHTLAIKTDGSLWSWGDNHQGQLGNGTFENQLSPIHVIDGVKSASAGREYSMILKNDNTLWTFGYNFFGQLGSRNTTSSSLPAKILDNVLSYSAGNEHSIAITSDDRLWVWGRNDLGQLGNGVETYRNIPVEVNNDILFMSTGSGHSLAIKHDKSLWSWGFNRYGQLGDGSVNTQYNPIRLIEDVIHASAGGWHSIAITNDNVLWTWGSNMFGQLGDGTINHSLTPIKVMEKAIFSDAGDGHSVAIKEDNSLWAWGRNDRGQLGDATTGDRISPIKILDDVVNVSAGYSYNMAIKTDGSLWAWGFNEYGQIGDGTQNSSLTPVKILDNVKAVSSGYNHTLAIQTDGSLWAWGRNDQGQLGDGTAIDRLFPVKIMDEVSNVSAGHSFSAITKEDGTLWIWGKNDRGQLGNGKTISNNIPAKIMDEVISISASDSHILVLKFGSSLWSWGDNIYGQLSVSNSAFNDTPFVLNPAFFVYDIPQIEAGSSTYYIDEFSNLWGWGFNSVGQLGDGTTINRLLPVLIMTDVSSVSSGNYHTLAVKTDGSLWAWGGNWKCELGDGTTTIRSTPVKIMDGVRNVSAGWYHSLALKNDGSLWAWGSSSAGQVGDGSWNGNVCTPKKVMENVTKIAAGGEHTMAIKMDGSLWGWGYNVFGQVSNGTNNWYTPYKIMDNVSNVSTGRFHTLAIKDDGSLWSWGANFQGQLGNGTTTHSSEPVKILNNISSISAGYDFSLATMPDGSLWAWGWNNEGQLGDGTKTDKILPTKVLENVTKMSAGNLGNSYAIKTDGSIWGWGNNDVGQLGDGSTESRLIPTIIPTFTPFSIDWEVKDLFLGQFLNFEGSIRANGFNLSSVVVYIDFKNDIFGPLKWYENKNLNKAQFDLTLVPNIKTGSAIFDHSQSSLIDPNLSKNINLIEGDYTITMILKGDSRLRSLTVSRDFKILGHIQGGTAGTLTVNRTSGSLSDLFSFSVIPKESTSNVVFMLEKAGTSERKNIGFGMRSSDNNFSFFYQFKDIGQYTITVYPTNQKGDIIGEGLSQNIVITEKYYIKSVLGPNSSDISDPSITFNVSTTVETSRVFYQVLKGTTSISTGFATKIGIGEFVLEQSFDKSGDYTINAYPANEAEVFTEKKYSKTMLHNVTELSVFGNFSSEPSLFSFELAKLSAEYALLAYEDMTFDYRGYYSRKSGANTPLDLINRLKTQKFEGFNLNEKQLLVRNYGYDSAPHNNAYTIATREISTDTGEKRTLVLIVLRGTYGREWQGNMQVTGDTFVDKSRYHYSFDYAATLVKNDVLNYLTKNDINDAIILVTGHSRGAAVGNILSARLTDHKVSNSRIGDVHAYLFATPNGVTDHNSKHTYENINNFSFSDDFVPQVPLSSNGWNFGKYGKNYVNSAQKLDSNGIFISSYYDSFRITGGRAPQFNERGTKNVLYHWEMTWPTIDLYYNKGTSYFELGDSMYKYMHDGIAVLANDKSSGADKTIASSLVFFMNSVSDILMPVTTFFLSGQMVNNYINDTHSPLTYYYALISGGFDVIPEIAGSNILRTIQTESNIQTFNLTSSPTEFDQTEVNRLVEFGNFESNASKLGWNMEDPTTWKGITWTGIDIGRVKAIHLPYLGLTGSLDLTDFSLLGTVDVSGNYLTELITLNCLELRQVNASLNQLVGLDLSSNVKLVEVYAPYNQLTNLELSSLTMLRMIDLSYNQLSDLNISSNTILEEAYLSGNSLSSIDLSGLNHLMKIDVSNNFLNVAPGTLFYIHLNEIEQKLGGWASYGDQRVDDHAMFDIDEITAMQEFSSQANNEEILQWNKQSPQLWQGVTWEKINDLYRIVRLDLSGNDLTGVLDLSNIRYLNYLNVSNTSLSEINISLLSNLNYFNAAYSNLHNIEINENHTLQTFFINNNRLDVSQDSQLLSYIESNLNMISHYENQETIVQPNVQGVENNGSYNHDITVEFDFGEATLNEELIVSGVFITEEGSYELVILHDFGLEYRLSFTIDKTAPLLTVLPYSNEITHLPVTVSVTTNEGTLNKTSHTFTQNGSFTFIATDEAGNVTEETVTITNIVSANEIKLIEVHSTPTRLQYLRGQVLDLSGGMISIETFGGVSTTLAMTLSMVSGYDPYSTVYGPQTITVTYAGLTTTFEVYLNRFIDVLYGHRNYNHINSLVELGIINGYSDSTFRPNNTLTRAQAAIMIARAIGLSTEGVSSNFTDVPSTHAAYKFISAAQNAGIINGYSDGTFRPNASITRAQIAIMVQRAFQVQASGTVMSFTDVPVGYAPKSFIETLASQKIVNGYSDGTFKPTNNVTRAQFSTMINNAIEYTKRVE